MVESTAYEVLRSEGVLEIRRYPLMQLATVRGMSDDDAFRVLLDYISGGNRRREKVPMTAPVVSGTQGTERIPMTVPVVSRPRSFSFVLPSSYPPHGVPEPVDSRVEIEVLPGRELAVIRFRGRTGERSVAERYSSLLAAVKRSGLAPRGEPFLMRYNPPFVPGFLRRNEVAVEVLPMSEGRG